MVSRARERPADLLSRSSMALARYPACAPPARTLAHQGPQGSSMGTLPQKPMHRGVALLLRRFHARPLVAALQLQIRATMPPRKAAKKVDEDDDLSAEDLGSDASDFEEERRRKPAVRALDALASPRAGRGPFRHAARDDSAPVPMRRRSALPRPGSPRPGAR